MQHVLLGKEHLLGRQLHTEVAASHHDAVHLFQDFFVILQSLLILDFGDNLNVLQLGTQDLADVVDIGGFADEGRCDAIHSVMLREIDNVVNVLLRYHPYILLRIR